MTDLQSIWSLASSKHDVFLLQHYLVAGMLPLDLFLVGDFAKLLFSQSYNFEGAR